MICPILKTIEIMYEAKRRAIFASLSNYRSDSLCAFCRAYTGRFRRMAERDPKHIGLYRSSAQFLVTLHDRCDSSQGKFLHPIMREFRENCRSLGIE